MIQATFASETGFEKYGRKSKRELFLDTMNAVVPWGELEALVAPYYPRAGNGRQRVGLRIPADADQHSWVIAITIPA